MYCKHCGKEITDETKFCPFCGGAQEDVNASQSAQANASQDTWQNNQYQAQNQYQEQNQYQAQNQQYNGQQQYAPQTQDARSGGFAFLCFLFPIVGLILYLVWKDTLPLRAKSCGKGAIIGVIVSVVFSIIYTVIIFAMAGAAGAGTYY